MINYDLARIKAVVLDVDGVLSASTIGSDAAGEPLRTVNIKDGYALQLAAKTGLHIAILTGGVSEAVKARYGYLGVEDIFMGCRVKLPVLKEFMAAHSYSPEEVLYMGDDIPDYEVMKHVGCPCCPRDAAPEIRDISLYVSGKDGGCGCVRDVIGQVLRAQGKWMAGGEAFGW